MTSSLESETESMMRVYHLDANRINSRGLDEHVNQLEKWHESGDIFLEMCETAYREAERGSRQRSDKAAKYTWVSANDSIGGEDAFRQQIAKVVFPLGITTQSERNDILILFDAKIAGATLITEDGRSASQPRGILGAARELERLGIRVLSTKEAVEEIESLLSG